MPGTHRKYSHDECIELVRKLSAAAGGQILRITMESDCRYGASLGGHTWHRSTINTLEARGYLRRLQTPISPMRTYVVTEEL